MRPLSRMFLRAILMVSPLSAAESEPAAVIEVIDDFEDQVKTRVSAGYHGGKVPPTTPAYLEKTERWRKFND